MQQGLGPGGRGGSPQLISGDRSSFRRRLSFSPVPEPLEADGELQVDFTRGNRGPQLLGLLPASGQHVHGSRRVIKLVVGCPYPEGQGPTCRATVEGSAMVMVLGHRHHLADDVLPAGPSGQIEHDHGLGPPADAPPKVTTGGGQLSDRGRQFRRRLVLSGDEGHAVAPGRVLGTVGCDGVDHSRQLAQAALDPPQLEQLGAIHRHRPRHRNAPGHAELQGFTGKILGLVQPTLQQRQRRLPRPGRPLRPWVTEQGRASTQAEDYDPLANGLDTIDPPDDATHPGFDDPAATAGKVPPGSYIDFVKNAKYSDREGFSVGDTDPSAEPIATKALPNKIEANSEGAVDDDGTTVQDGWVGKANKILKDENLDQDEKEEAMTELADQVQKVTEAAKSQENQDEQSPDDGNAPINHDSSADTDLTNEDAGAEADAADPTKPDATDVSPDGIDPSQVDIDFSDPEWQIKASADANDDIQYADHPGATPAYGSGTEYDGVDYGADFTQPDDLPADAVDSVYEDPTIDPYDDPMAAALAPVDDGSDAADHDDGALELLD